MSSRKDLHRIIVNDLEVSARLRFKNTTGFWPDDRDTADILNISALHNISHYDAVDACLIERRLISAG